MFFLYKVEDYKALCSNQQLPPYPPKSHTGKRIKEIIPFTLASKRKKRIPWDKPSQEYKVPNMNTLKY